MNCSLNCFCDFLQAPTSERKRNIVRRYKDSRSGEAKGRSTHYQPVLNAIKGTLCPGGNAEQKIAAIAKACIRPTSTDRLNQGRIESNLAVFHAFRSIFGSADLKTFPSPRMQFLAGPDVAINVQPDLYFEAHGKKMIVKLCISKKKRSEQLVRMMIQMLYRGVRGKALGLPIESLFFIDVRAGKTYSESAVNKSLESELEPTVKELKKLWTE